MKNLGSIHEIMIDKLSGKVAYAVMSFGGFLGICNQYHPLHWLVLKYNANIGCNVGTTRARLPCSRQGSAA